MSQQNVEIARRHFEALQGGDIDAYLEVADPEVEIDFSEVRGPYRGVFRGYDGAREIFDSFWEAWESITPLSTDTSRPMTRSLSLLVLASVAEGAG